MKEPISHPELLRLLNYDSDTGIFTWKIGRSGAKKGAVAGSRDSYGYVQIKLLGRPCLAHRLAWFYVHEVWPPKEIDHEDKIRHHNWIDNLRECTRSQNIMNSKTRSDNTTSYRGVNEIKNTCRFMARIQIEGKREYLGCFATAEEASTVYEAKAKELFGEFYSKN